MKRDIAIVTGVSRGIGKAIAIKCLKEGLRVVGCARNEEGLQSLRAELADFRETLELVKADVTRLEDLQGLVENTVSRFGGIDILIHNAGGAGAFGDFSIVKRLDWEQAYQLNVVSVVELTQLALPHLRQSAGARLVLVASASARAPGKFNPHYSAAKAALLNLGQYLASHLAADGIRVNTIAPGAVLTEGWYLNCEQYAKERGISSQDAFQQLHLKQLEKIPIGRMATSEEIADCVSFLISESAAMLTGAVLPIDGGLNVRTL